MARSIVLLENDQVVSLTKYHLVTCLEMLSLNIDVMFGVDHPVTHNETSNAISPDAALHHHRDVWMN